jgi:hypothetical protein
LVGELVRQLVRGRSVSGARADGSFRAWIGGQWLGGYGQGCVQVGRVDGCCAAAWVCELPDAIVIARVGFFRGVLDTLACPALLTTKQPTKQTAHQQSNYPPPTVSTTIFSTTNSRTNSLNTSSSTTLAETQTSARLVTQSRHEWRSAPTRVRAHSCMHANVQLLALRGPRVFMMTRSLLLLLLPSIGELQSPRVSAQSSPNPAIMPSTSVLPWRLTHIGSCRKSSLQTCHPHRAFNRRPVASYQSN